MSLPVYVLVGGGSRRFGVAKATHVVDGEPWALHVGRRLARDDAAITLVGEFASAAELDLVRRIADSPRVAGPLGGLLAALEDRGDGLLTLASCDLVRPDPAWLKPLLTQHATDPTLHVAAYTASERWQPFPSVVHTRWLPQLARVVEAGARSFQSVFEAAITAGVGWPGEAVPQANTPEQLHDLLACDSRSS